MNFIQKIIAAGVGLGIGLVPMAMYAAAPTSAECLSFYGKGLSSCPQVIALDMSLAGVTSDAFAKECTLLTLESAHQKVVSMSAGTTPVDCTFYKDLLTNTLQAQRCEAAYLEITPLTCSGKVSAINANNHALYIHDCVTAPPGTVGLTGILDLPAGTISAINAARINNGVGDGAMIALGDSLCNALAKYRTAIQNKDFANEEIKVIQEASKKEDLFNNALCACQDKTAKTLTPAATGNVSLINKECCAVCKVGPGDFVYYKGGKSLCAKPKADIKLPGITAFPNPVKSSITSPQQFLGNVIKVVLGIIGSIALAMVIYGGFTWMVAAGNSERVATGQKTVVWAVFGLIIIFSSYALVDFVLTALG